MSQWVESHSALKDHPKRKKLSRLLGIRTHETIGLLHCLWWWAMDYAPDGDLSRFESAEVADGCEWEGDPDVLLGALTTARWINKDSLTLHNWELYGEKLHRRRQANAERMRAARAQHVQRTCATQGRQAITDSEQGEHARAQHVQRTCMTRAEREDRTEEDKELSSVSSLSSDALSRTRARDAAPSRGASRAALAKKNGGASEPLSPVEFARQILAHPTAGEPAARAYCEMHDVDWDEVIRA